MATPIASTLLVLTLVAAIAAISCLAVVVTVSEAYILVYHLVTLKTLCPPPPGRTF